MQRINLYTSFLCTCSFILVCCRSISKLKCYTYFLYTYFKMITISRNYFLGSMQLLVALAGTVGNLLVILLIFWNPRLLKNNHYYLVLHLAICDLSILVFTSSEINNAFTGRSMINSPALCKLWWPTHTVFYNAGIFFMVLISIVRYQAVLKPLEPAVSRCKVKVLAVLVYVLSTICVLPYVLVLQFNYKSGCVEMWPMQLLNIFYTSALSAVQYFIPIVLLSIVYWRICIVLAKQNRKMKLLCGPLHQENLSPYQRFRQYRNVRTFFASLTVVTCFAVTALPSQIIYILSTSNVIEFPWYYFWFHVLNSFGVSAVNPFIYGTLDRKLLSSFTKRMRKVLHVALTSKVT